MRSSLWLTLPLLLAGCAASTPAPETASVPPASEKAAETAKAAPQSGPQTLGDAIPADAAPVKVTDLVQNAEAYNGKRIAIEGTITKLCKKKGCWFEITDGAGGKGVLITASRYHIFLQQGSEGRQAVAFGEFKREVQDLAEAKHLAEDAGEPAPTEAPVILRLVADGVALR